nr:MAG TPA: hypothetical protein [Caudoviricetes sp.]
MRLKSMNIVSSSEQSRKRNICFAMTVIFVPKFKYNNIGV